MSRKRRIFDIEMPEEGSPETFPAGKKEDAGKPAEEPKPAKEAKPARRGPMATAISETAQSVRERQEAAAKIREENDSLAREHVRLKKLGLITDLVPLDKIATHKLVRDRAKGDDFELAELVASIRAIGLSNPIRVEALPDGTYELIQGYRRVSAFRALLDETGDAETWGKIPAGMVPQGENLEGLYRQMVDENLVRKDISFAEMAQLALNYAADPDTEENDPDRAVAVLFQSAGYQKRSYIRQFIKLVSVLGEDLNYPAEIPRALGLSLVSRMEEVEGVATAIRQELKGWDNRSIKDEIDVLRRYAGSGAPSGALSKPVKASTPGGRAKTTFQIDRPQGRAKCVAAAGRLEVRMDRDFTAVERRRLEQAVRDLLDSLDRGR